MEIDFNYKFVNLDGTIIPEQPDTMEEVDGKMVPKNFPPFTLRTACINILVMRQASTQGKDKPLTAEEKIKRYELAKRIYGSKGLVDLSVEEIALLKKLVGEIYPPITVGQAFNILDPHSEKK